MIQKTIHYCWFGGNEKSDIIKRCIESWKVYCPDYEIIEWNETNFDLSANDFVKEAYECKKWAFVTDYVRLMVVYKFGGIYMDTDVEIYGSLDQYILHNSFFCYQSAPYIATGLGFGAEKGNIIIKEMLDMYVGKHFLVNGKMDLTPCPALNTEALKKIIPEFKHDNQTAVYSDDTLLVSTADYSNLMRHYGTATWVDGETAVTNKNGLFKKMCRKLRTPTMYDFVKSHFGEKILKRYLWLVYDLPEYGFEYYVKRVLKRRK